MTRDSGRQGDRDEARRLLAVGLGLAGLEAAALLVLLAVDPATFGRIAAVAAAAFVGGRIPGVLASLELGFGVAATSGILIALNTAWLLIALPAFLGVSRWLAGSRLLAPLMAGTADRARAGTGWVRTFGSWGLPLFVWLPFPLTGALIGAVIGLTLGIPLRRLVVLVLSSMWLGVSTWTVGIEYLYLFSGPAGRVACWAVAGAALLYSVLQRFRQPAGG